MTYIIDSIEKPPHPEEAATRLSRRTYRAIQPSFNSLTPSCAGKAAVTPEASASASLAMASRSHNIAIGGSGAASPSTGGVRSRRPAARNSSTPGRSRRRRGRNAARKPGVVTHIERPAGAASGGPWGGPSPLPSALSMRALAEADAADLFDLGAGDRLVVGDHRQGLDRGARQSAGDPRLDAQGASKMGAVRNAQPPASRTRLTPRPA